MNQKVENVETVSEPNKITEEELKELQEHVNKINNAQLQVGQLATQKHSILVDLIPELQQGLRTFQEKLEKAYGPVNVNITDGTYEETSQPK